MNPEAQDVRATSGPQAQPRALPLATGYRLLRHDIEYPIKSRCPYCGGKLRMSINGSELDSEYGTGWCATELDINCDKEPDIDSPKWEGWWAEHSYDFCEGWHDLHDRVVRSLKRTHRVDYDNAGGVPRPESALMPKHSTPEKL